MTLALSTIAAGLIVHWGGTALPPVLRDVLGDALWAIMIGWWVGALMPAARPSRRAAVALALCWAIEFSQLYHSTMVDGWRQTTAGELVLGTGFDLRDLGSYAIGVLVTAGVHLRRK